MPHELEVVGSAGVLVPVQFQPGSPLQVCLVGLFGACSEWWMGKRGARVRSSAEGGQKVVEQEVHREVMNQQEVGGQ